MQDIWLPPAVILSLLSFSVSACNRAGMESEMLLSQEVPSICEETREGVETLWADFQQLHMFDEEQDTSYWEYWGTDMVDNPMISSGIKQSHFGLALWQPNDEDVVSDMTYSEWMMSHGFQFSLGFGEPNQPKFRFDYQWHEFKDDHFSFQVEVPF